MVNIEYNFPNKKKEEKEKLFVCEAKEDMTHYCKELNSEEVKQNIEKYLKKM